MLLGGETCRGRAQKGRQPPPWQARWTRSMSLREPPSRPLTPSALGRHFSRSENHVAESQAIPVTMQKASGPVGNWTTPQGTPFGRVLRPPPSRNGFQTPDHQRVGLGHGLMRRACHLTRDDRADALIAGSPGRNTGHERELDRARWNRRPDPL